MPGITEWLWLEGTSEDDLVPTPLPWAGSSLTRAYPRFLLWSQFESLPALLGPQTFNHF